MGDYASELGVERSRQVVIVETGVDSYLKRSTWTCAHTQYVLMHVDNLIGWGGPDWVYFPTSTLCLGITHIVFGNVLRVNGVLVFKAFGASISHP